MNVQTNLEPSTESSTAAVSEPGNDGSTGGTLTNEATGGGGSQMDVPENVVHVPAPRDTAVEGQRGHVNDGGMAELLKLIKEDPEFWVPPRYELAGTLGYTMPSFFYDMLLSSAARNKNDPNAADGDPCQLLFLVSGGEAANSLSVDSAMSSSQRLGPAKMRINELLGDHPMVKSLLAGAVSGTCSTILLQPFDLVKTRIQTASPISATGSSVRMLPIMSSVIKSDNLIGLWRGTLPSLVRTVPGVGIYFTSLNYLQLKLHYGSEKKPTALEAVCLGVGARTFAGTLLIPVTVLKTRFESGLFNYSSMTQALKVTYATEGARGLFSGLTPTLLRDAPFSGLYFMFYSQLKCLLPQTSTSSPSSTKPVGTFLCGLTAGLLASVATHPFDVVKTKMQLQSQTYKNLTCAIVIIYQNKGLNGFFSGLAPRMIRRSLMSALAWTVYESLMKNIGLK